MLVQGGGILDKAPRPLIKDIVKDASSPGAGGVLVDGNSNLVGEQYSDR